MINLYDAMRVDPRMTKLQIGDFLFAEYTCGVREERVGVWAPADYLVNVVAGKKTWHTSEAVWPAKRGDSLFFRKGAAIVDQSFEQEFCLLTFFVPDHLVRTTVREIADSLGALAKGIAPIRSAAWVENDLTLSAFFESMRTYLAGKEKPSEPLLRLKLKELIVSILTSGRNPSLAAYFRALGDQERPSLGEIMEANFRYNLSLEEYARLCHRSLSSFKREFQAHFNETPGKWLLRKRLDYAAGLLRGSKMNVTEVAFECGFEDVSHFSRVFKEYFQEPPMTYRLSLLCAA
jgi:AraC family transcriptional regulator, exoenzyme S synthesis regulatory protein ExsA